MTEEKRAPFTTAREELIGKTLIHHERPARVIAVNKSEAGHFYVIETYDTTGTEVFECKTVPAVMINQVFSGCKVVDWRLPNLETLPRLAPGSKVRLFFNGEIMTGSIIKGFDDGRGYRVKVEGTSFTVPVLNEAILPLS